MFKHLRKGFLVIFAMALSQQGLLAQQRTGNIVEYFGKEKVNDINEGELQHVFSKGLLVRYRSIGLNSDTFPEDPVFRQFLFEEDYLPREGQVFDIDGQGNELKWEAIGVDSTNTFSENGLRSGYLFLTYNSKREETLLFEASGHTVALVNGLPQEGDHYDFGYNLIPITLKQGRNTFLLKAGRFPRIRARLIKPASPVQFTLRDMTIPDILTEEKQDLTGAIRVINNTDDWIKGYTITASHAQGSRETQVPPIAPRTMRKVPFNFAPAQGDHDTDLAVQMTLKNGKGTVASEEAFTAKIKSNSKHHKRTFISNIDGSVQYFSVAPSLQAATGQALFLSVHGASVEATNQARAYKQKDWGTLVAPTNRRPFGFAWEDWGRLDALEVLQEAKRIYQPDKSKIYLTGHSMGGHGTWYLGATYPDYFAAIAPCAGYPDLLEYRNSFSRRLANASPRQMRRYGITPKMLERMTYAPEPSPLEKLVTRAGTPSRTVKLMRNYLQQGVYILHGEDDNVVPTFLAQDMRKRLGTFHPDFTYYEYPGGTHWYGDHSVDWPPIFDFFKQRTIKKPEEVEKMEFYTGSPGVSAHSQFVSIHQQSVPFAVSSFVMEREQDTLEFQLDNVDLLSVDFSAIETPKGIVLDSTALAIAPNAGELYFKKREDGWQATQKPSAEEKGPHRNGGFKDAFTHNVVFVYATKGDKQTNDWYYNKAKFDAETFWYKANGNVELVRDVDFTAKKYADRNVVVYGNKDNNAAWGKLLKDAPVQVEDGGLSIGGKTLKGEQYGLYVIVPRPDSDTASVGIVSATGVTGMKSAYANHYLVNGTTFPDLLLFDDTVLSSGTSAVKCAGFFGNDWSVENGDFEWR